MIAKHLTSSNLGRVTAVIAVFSLLSKILGLVRDAVFSHQFGAGLLMDAYFAAFRIPDFIYNLLILGTFSVAFIPVFSQYLIQNKPRANRLASSIINSTLILMLVLTAGALVFVDPLTRAIAPGFSGEIFELTKLFTRIFLLSPLLLTLSSIVSSLLNAHKRFALVAAAPIFYNLSIIAGALWLYPSIGPAGLAWGVVVGALLHFAVQVPQVISAGFRYHPIIIWGDEGFRKFWRLYLPRVFSMGTEQVTALIVSIFGSFLGTGALAAYYYANNLQSVLLSLFGVSFAIAVFPLLSDLFNKTDQEGFRDVIAKTSIQILFFVIPLSVLLLVLRAQATRLVLGIGQNTSFTFDDTRLVAQVLGLFSVSLFAQALIPLFSRAFYAIQNTIAPVVIGFITVAINIAATYFLTERYGIAGMPLAFSVTSVIHVLMLLAHLHSKFGHLHDQYLSVNVLKIVIASLLGGAAAFVSLSLAASLVNMQTYWGVLAQAVIAGSAGMLVYLAAGWVLGLSETRELVKLLRTTVGKIGKPLNIIFNWQN